MIKQKRERLCGLVKAGFLILSIILISILLTEMSFAEIKDDPNYSYKADKPGDGPRFASPAVREASPSASESTKEFRIDTDPELDFYQPCDGGNNEIDFYINVHDVDISSVKSAILTLAVFDVDYNCEIECCERDSVYVNGHRLTTPTA